MTNRDHEDDIILHVIVIASILIEILIDLCRGLTLLLFSLSTIQIPGKTNSHSNTTENHKCLTSLNSASSTPTPGKHDSQSSDIKSTRSGSTKTQRLSPSTKRRSTTAVQKKVDGGTTQDSQSSPTASSPRGKRSKPSSSTTTSTRSQTSQASGSRRRTTTTKSTSPTTTLRSTPKPNHTTADDTNGNTTDWIEHQPTEPLHVLLESQEEVPEHTVLCTKVSKHPIKD